MRLNTTTCHAMRITLYLVRNRRVVSSSELAETLKISLRYIFQITSKLRDGGFISTITGTSGGFVMSREASSISVFDVIELVEGEMTIPECLTGLPDCGEPCRNQNLLSSLGAMRDDLETYLKSIKFDALSDLDINGPLAEIVGMVGTHIGDMKQRGLV